VSLVGSRVFASIIKLRPFGIRIGSKFKITAAFI
jgi:hypothetical protein